MYSMCNLRRARYFYFKTRWNSHRLFLLFKAHVHFYYFKTACFYYIKLHLTTFVYMARSSCVFFYYFKAHGSLKRCFSHLLDYLCGHGSLKPCFSHGRGAAPRDLAAVRVAREALHRRAERRPGGQQERGVEERCHEKTNGRAASNALAASV